MEQKREKVLAEMIDKSSVVEVLSDIAKICGDRGEDIKNKWADGGPWPDDRIAAEWVLAMTRIDHVATTLDKNGIPGVCDPDSIFRGK